MAAICRIRLSKIKIYELYVRRITVPNLIKIVQKLQRYGNSMVFTMAAVRHLGFVKFKFFLTVGVVKRPILHQRTKFCKDRSNLCGDIAIFVIFQDGGRRHRGFSKIQNLNG